MNLIWICVQFIHLPYTYTIQYAKDGLLFFLFSFIKFSTVFVIDKQMEPIFFFWKLIFFKCTFEIIFLNQSDALSTRSTTEKLNFKAISARENEKYTSTELCMTKAKAMFIGLRIHKMLYYFFFVGFDRVWQARFFFLPLSFIFSSLLCSVLNAITADIHLDICAYDKTRHTVDVYVCMRTMCVLNETYIGVRRSRELTIYTQQKHYIFLTNRNERIYLIVDIVIFFYFCFNFFFLKLQQAPSAVKEWVKKNVYRHFQYYSNGNPNQTEKKEPKNWRMKIIFAPE